MTYDFKTDWFSHNEPAWREHLSPLIDTPAHSLEIGSYEGRSAIWTVENILTHPQSSITCVDAWYVAGIEHRFDANIVLTGQSHKFVKMRGESQIILRRLPFNHFDLIYIDGEHEGLNVLEDAVHSYRLLKPGGFLVFDDYLWENEARDVTPKTAIDAFIAVYSRRVKLVHSGYQVILQKL